MFNHFLARAMLSMSATFYADLDSLRQHFLTVHNSDRVFQCALCQVSFADRILYRAHELQCGKWKQEHEYTDDGSRVLIVIDEFSLIANN